MIFFGVVAGVVIQMFFFLVFRRIGSHFLINFGGLLVRLAGIRENLQGLAMIREDSQGFARFRSVREGSPGFARIRWDSLGFARLH